MAEVIDSDLLIPALAYFSSPASVDQTGAPLYDYIFPLRYVRLLALPLLSSPSTSPPCSSSLSQWLADPFLLEPLRALLVSLWIDFDFSAIRRSDLSFLVSSLLTLFQLFHDSRCSSASHSRLCLASI